MDADSEIRDEGSERDSPVAGCGDQPGEPDPASGESATPRARVPSYFTIFGSGFNKRG
jgi:hypothetical protein